MQEKFLRPLWGKVFRFDINFIVIAFILLGILRIIGLASHAINLVVLGFLIMWFLPFVFFNKDGRLKMGIKKPDNWLWVIISFLLGGITAGFVYVFGYFLYGTGMENWGMTVVNEYTARQEVIIPAVFAVVTFLSMLFSPIGEELFFRGMIYEVLAGKLSSYKWAGFWSSIAFAAIHIPHHDIMFADRRFVSILIPLILWFILMYLVSQLFIFARRKSGSILGAIVCHSGYILSMNLFVYYVLLANLK